MGFGMAKAGGDAQALAAALAAHDDVDAALAAYDRERQPIGARIVGHGRRLGTHLGVDLATDADRAMSALLQDPLAFMAWIAVPNFLAAG
jgi:2-polyprenyl-6-methoxyphenol hydroxylase-like FAD-dependent oxidoreductase